LHASCSSISASFRAILCRLVHSSSWPAIAGKGDHPSAERSDGGRGAGRDETLSTKAKRRVRRPLHHASRGPPPPLSQGRTTQLPVLALRFCLRPELCQRFHETGLPKREAERRKAHTERPLRAIAALPLGGFVARAAFGGRARLPALYRGSRQRPLGLRLSPVPRFMAAPTDHSVRHPGSELLADRRRGRPGGFPNRPRMELRTPSRAPLPLASIGRHRLTSLGRAGCVGLYSLSLDLSRNCRAQRDNDLIL